MMKDDEYVCVSVLRLIGTGAKGRCDFQFEASSDEASRAVPANGTHRDTLTSILRHWKRPPILVVVLCATRLTASMPCFPIGRVLWIIAQH